MWRLSPNWQGTFDQTDTEFLHDLRITVRRPRTVLADAKQVLPAAILDHTRDEFAWPARPGRPAEPARDQRAVPRAMCRIGRR